ncbi:hypothetical protein [Tumebacillus algifaecis]|uniref:hypothetical protein n=1 Tax=Tumebacillus algifaecis TaxID=1214604 RepID=UPI0012FD30F8|nr:hypothetical protein [Tumebacillus algifaecis]
MLDVFYEALGVQGLEHKAGDIGRGNKLERSRGNKWKIIVSALLTIEQLPEAV